MDEAAIMKNGGWSGDMPVLVCLLREAMVVLK